MLASNFLLIGGTLAYFSPKVFSRPRDSQGECNGITVNGDPEQEDAVGGNRSEVCHIFEMDVSVISRRSAGRVSHRESSAVITSDTRILQAGTAVRWSTRYTKERCSASSTWQIHAQQTK